MDTMDGGSGYVVVYSGFFLPNIFLRVSIVGTTRMMGSSRCCWRAAEIGSKEKVLDLRLGSE